MIFKSFTVMGVLAMLSATAQAGSPPKGLYGKSIIVTWGEQRSQRMFHETNFRDVNVGFYRAIYVSTKGQSFNRFSAGEQTHLGKGTGGTNNVGGSGELEFNGRTIMGTSSAKGGLARRMIIELNDSFTTCEAHVIFAKEAGSDAVIGYDIRTGVADKEIRSAAVSSV